MSRQVGMTRKVEEAMEQEPRRHDPQGGSKTNCRHSRKDCEEGNFGNEAVAAPGHRSKQDIQTPNNRKDDGVK